MADREPQRRDDRPTGEMTDATRSQHTDHATHDLHVLAAAADRSVDDTTRIAAERQAADCGDCAALFADLRSISAGLAELPRELAVTRDFRISPERAAQLRPAGWRGVVQTLFGSGPSLRPFASALTTLGVAGLLLTVALPGLVGGFGSAAGGAASAPESDRNLLSTVGQSVGLDKANATAVPAVPGAGGGGPAVAAASPGASAVDVSNQYTSIGSAAPRLATGTDSATPSPSPATPAAPFPLVGVIAAASLGALLLGLFLLIRSRARPFDSSG